MYKQLSKALMAPLKLLENPIANGIIKIFLVVYAAAIVPELPNYMKKLFKNPAMKVLFLTLMTYVGLKDPVMSLLIGIGFTLTMLSLNKLETISDVHDILDAVIDVPQEVLNELIDGAQDLVTGGANAVDSVTGKAGIKVAGPLAEMANMVVDGVQGIGNNVIDGAQGVVGGIVGTVIPKEQKPAEAKEEEKVEEAPAQPKESFSMAAPKFNQFEMGSLGDISGADAEPKTEGQL